MKFLVVFSYSLLLDISHIDGKLTAQPVCVGYYEMPRKIGKRKIHFFPGRPSCQLFCHGCLKLPNSFGLVMKNVKKDVCFILNVLRI